MTLDDLLAGLEPGTSDLHLVVGQPPVIRHTGKLIRQENIPPFDAETLMTLLLSVLPLRDRGHFEHGLGAVLETFQTPQGHFQLHAFHERGRPCATIRVIPSTIPTLNQLRLCDESLPVLIQLTQMTRGLVLVTGPTGSGKTTLMYSLVEEINQSRAERIAVIEETSSYVFTSQQSIITQQRIGTDSPDVATALRGLIHSDPDVVVIGSVPNIEVVGLMLTLAETGHLVFAQLHQTTTREALQRLVSAFPESNREEVQRQLGNNINAVLALQLVPAIGGGRVPALETLQVSPELRLKIRTGDFNITPTTSMNEALDTLVATGTISAELAAQRRSP